MSVTKVTYKKKSGKNSVSYRADVYVSGTRVKTKSFDTAAAAHGWHDRYKTNWENGTPGTVANEDYTFGDCVEQFMEHERGFLKMRQSSRQSFETRLPHFRTSPIVKVRMGEFSDLTVDLWLRWLLKQPTAQRLKRKTFISELKVLHRFLSWYRNYVDSKFAVPIVERHRSEAKFKAVKSRRKDYFIREDDVRPWLDWLKQNDGDPFFHEVATFMVLTGTRLGEACGLKWEAVDLERGEAHITRVMAWDQKTRMPYPEELTKTDESDRLIQLPGAALAMMRSVQTRSGKSGLVFANLDGVTPKDNAIRSHFNRGFKALNLPWTATRILRHTWGTLARVATKDLNKVQANMGHTDIGMTQRYAKVAAMLDKSAVEETATLMGF
jgi:integrase